MDRKELENQIILMSGYAKGGVDITDRVIWLADTIKARRDKVRRERDLAILAGGEQFSEYLNEIDEEEPEW